MAVLPNLRSAIGNTPMVHLGRFGRGMAASVYGKCEFMNPGGSVKDRIGFFLVEAALATGKLQKGGTIVEATAGNTGMALAMAAAENGNRLIAVMTTKMSREKVDLLKAFGAEVVVCPYEVDPSSGDHFIATARRLAASIPGAWHVDQFANSANAAAHYAFTGPEIWADMEGKIDAFVAGIGTGGSMAGIGRFLKEQNPSVQLVLADPDGSILKALVDDEPSPIARPYLIEGIGGDFVPFNADLSLIDEAIRVPDGAAVETAFAAFQTEGMFVGASAGAILYAAGIYASRVENAGKRIVALLPDGGRSYLTTIYNADWRASHGIEVEPGDPFRSALQLEERAPCT